MEKRNKTTTKNGKSPCPSHIVLCRFIPVYSSYFTDQESFTGCGCSKQSTPLAKRQSLIDERIVGTLQNKVRERYKLLAGLAFLKTAHNDTDVREYSSVRHDRDGIRISGRCCYLSWSVVFCRKLPVRHSCMTARRFGVSGLWV